MHLNELKFQLAYQHKECKGLCYSAESDAGTLPRKDIPKLPKELSKVEIFLKVKLQVFPAFH